MKADSPVIIACPGGAVFAAEVIHHLRQIYRRRDPAAKVPHFKVPVRYSRFPNGEIKAEILESIRGRDVYVFQDVENRYPLPFNEGTADVVCSVNDHLMNLFVTIDAIQQAGAGSIIAVLPVYPYARQHKKKGREGVTSSRIGNILESMGVSRIITLDIHSREIGNGFQRLLIDNLHASYQIIRALIGLIGVPDKDFVVVSPDTGAVDRNKFFANTLKSPLALLYKERDYSKVTRDAMDNNIAAVKLLGDVHGKTVFLADDMLGTGGTLLKAMQFLRENGAAKVIASISLPLFSGSAISYFDEAYMQGGFYRIIGTNAVYHDDELCKKEWYVNVNISGLFATIIDRLYRDQSLSSLLDNRHIIEKLLSGKDGAVKETAGDGAPC
jgi:ribose-phosphate pyrophosphokinase